MATVFSPANLNPQEDAEALEKAMKGLGTDEQSIINILGYRTVAERQLIAQTYKASYGKDLSNRLKQELSGEFRDIVLKSFYDRAHLQAIALFDAMKGFGTKESVIITTICTMTNEEIADLRDAFEDILKEKHENPLRRDIEKDVCSELSGDFERFIVALLQGVREEGVDEQSAETDAEALYGAGEKQVGTDESIFTKIFARRSFAQIRLLDELYFKKAGHGILKAIQAELSGDYRKAVKTLVKTAFHRDECIADLLRDTMKGGGTDDEGLIRLVLGYSEDSMAGVKDVFEAKYGKSLEEWIRDDTSGDYRKFLLAIVDSK